MIKDEVVYMVNRFNAIEQSVLTLYISKYSRLIRALRPLRGPLSGSYLPRRHLTLPPA